MGLLASSSVPFFSSQIHSPTPARCSSSLVSLGPLPLPLGMEMEGFGCTRLSRYEEQHTLRLECGWGLGPFLEKVLHEKLSVPRGILPFQGNASERGTQHVELPAQFFISCLSYLLIYFFSNLESCSKIHIA